MAPSGLTAIFPPPTDKVPMATCGGSVDREARHGLVSLRGPGFLVRYEGELAAVMRGPGFLVHYEGEFATVTIAR